jgi:hypothetical protein
MYSHRGSAKYSGWKMSEIRYTGDVETFEKKAVDSDGALHTPTGRIHDALLLSLPGARAVIPTMLPPHSQSSWLFYSLPSSLCVRSAVYPQIWNHPHSVYKVLSFKTQFRLMAIFRYVAPCNLVWQTFQKGLLPPTSPYSNSSLENLKPHLFPVFRVS